MKKNNYGQDNLITIFVPIYNEERSILKLFSELIELSNKINNEGTSVEILIHDNSSIDSSWNLIAENVHKFKNFKAVRFSQNIGYQSSLTLSFSNASGSAIVVYQSDQQDPIELIFDMHQEWKGGSNCIVGVAKNRSETLKEKIGRFIFVRLLKSTSDLKLNFWFTDFYLLDRSLFKNFIGLPLSNQFIRGRIIENFKIDKLLSYDRKPRTKGESKFTFSDKYSLALDALLLHGSKIIRRINLFASIVSILALLLGIFLSINFLIDNDETRFMISVFGSLGILLSIFIILLLGFMLEFIMRLYRNFHSLPDSNYHTAIAECLVSKNFDPGITI
jgi:hypothetical protein